MIDSLSPEALPTVGFANANEPIRRMFDRFTLLYSLGKIFSHF
jgi:hypothetical protein